MQVAPIFAGMKSARKLFAKQSAARVRKPARPARRIANNLIMKKIILIIIILIVAAGGLYFLFLRQPANEQPPNSQTNDKSGIPADWKNYKNQQFGFEIFYAPQYPLSEGASQKFNVGEFFVGQGENIATISLPENSYPGTNYYDGFLTVSAQLQSSEFLCKQAQRERDTQMMNLNPYKIINGLEFSSGQSSGAAAGTLAKNKIYRAFINSACYEITLNLFEGNIGNYPAGAVSQVDEADIFSKLETVMSTFKITGAPQVQATQSAETAGQFLKNYLDAYKNVGTKKNFAEVKSFLTQDALDFMQSEAVPFETNYTRFDSYQVLSVENMSSHFSAKVKLFSNGEVLKKPDSSDIMEIDIIKENGQFKTETWYFTQ